MTRHSVRADDSFLLGLRENIHHSAKTLGPIAFCHAMNETDVNVVRSELAPETIEISARAVGIARECLGENGNLVARHVLECFGYMRMAAIGVGGVEESQTTVVTVQQEIR